MRKIIYSLTQRGLYSELVNLALAKVFADNYGYILLVNSRHWNSKIKNGLSEWFIPYFDENDKPFKREIDRGSGGIITEEL